MPPNHPCCAIVLQAEAELCRIEGETAAASEVLLVAPKQAAAAVAQQVAEEEKAQQLVVQRQAGKVRLGDKAGKGPKVKSKS